MRPPRLMPAALMALVLGTSLAACGEDRDESGTNAGGTGTAATAEEPAGEPVATVQLEESDFEIEPSEPEVDADGVVEFEIRNTGDTEHALEVEGPDGERETEPFGPGERATLEVRLEPGEYKMYCPVGDHEERGMTGTIKVAGGSGGGSGDDDGGTTTGDDSDEPPGGGGY